MSLPQKIEDEISAYVRQQALSPEKEALLRERVQAIFHRMQYSPEEPVGVVTAQSLSEPATQMSLDHQEKIIVKHKGAIQIAPIGEFTDRMMEAFGASREEGWDICDLSSMEVYVPSLQANEKIAWSKVLACSRHAAPERLVRVRTLSGREITATDSHSFLARRDNRVVAVSGKDLRAGDRTPAIRLLPEHCLESIDVRAYADPKRAKKPLQTLQLDRRTGWLFGAYLAKGNATKHFTSNVDPVFQGHLGFAAAHGPSADEYDNTRGFALSHDLRINSTMLSTLLERACGTGSGNKKVPAFAFSGAEDFVAALLQAYFEGDGNVSVERGVIRASSNSRDLRDGIALLLARFSIFALKGRGKQFTLTIPGKYARVFREKIGFVTQKNAGKLDALCSLPPAKQDFVDCVGGFGDLFLATARKLGYPTRRMQSFTKRQKIGREAVLKYLVVFSALAQEKGVDLFRELALMKQMHASDVVWDEIVEVSPVRPTHPQVYDLTVEGTESFTTFAGIVTHNTMRTYHFAASAGIQVTLGLPRMLEIFDARKDPKTPTMKVFILPSHQNLDEIKRIAENIKDVRAKDITNSVMIDLTEATIRCKLDLEKMKSLEIDPQKMAKLLKIRNTTVEIQGDSLVVQPKKKDISQLHRLKYTLLESHVKGIKGISQVVVSKEEGEWVINTLGSNLKKVFAIEGVDYARTTTNNIFEVYDVLGIEAAREMLVRQAAFTMDEQGLVVDIRYILLLADTMCADGGIKAIGRYGISGQKASPFVRASFEETKKHFTAAAIKGERDPLAGTVENIMVNQVAPIGTGAYQLVGRLPEKGIPVKDAKE
ncbi:MAG: intein-containing DNA-directed RNA polymerase subunit A'' [Candidatus Aenigmarchaeota archaeon]|nr:intein-containing DNA-directed RNA polymerase subunit A'' [Candidatus Aenigmarchaeota archaeon]